MQRSGREACQIEKDQSRDYLAINTRWYSTRISRDFGYNTITIEISETSWPKEYRQR